MLELEIVVVAVDLALHDGPRARAVEQAEVPRYAEAHALAARGIRGKVAIVPIQAEIDAVGADCGREVVAVDLLRAVERLRSTELRPLSSGFNERAPVRPPTARPSTTS
jgi:hypothetical protein